MTPPTACLAGHLALAAGGPSGLGRASQETSYVTGSAIVVDGGRTA